MAGSADCAVVQASQPPELDKREMNGTANSSKRHSRTSSGQVNGAVFSPPATPVARSPGPLEPPSTPEKSLYMSAKHLVPPQAPSPIISVPNVPVSQSSPSPSPSPSPTTPDINQTVLTPVPKGEEVIKREIGGKSAEEGHPLPTPSPTPERSSESSEPNSPSKQLPPLPASRPSSVFSLDQEQAGPSSPGPSSPSSSAYSPRSTVGQRPGSRFRVVSNRGLNPNTQPARPSPLRPVSHLAPRLQTETGASSSHARSQSNTSTRSATPGSPAMAPRVPSSASSPATLERLSPGNRDKPLPGVGSAVPQPSPTPPRSNTPTAPRSIAQTIVPLPRSNTPVARSATPPAPPVAAPTPTALVPYSVLSRASSASPVLPSPTNGMGGGFSSKPAPYRAGFQPKGVYRHRTEEFEAIRAKKAEGKRTEEKRLTRRLEKLIDLHFSPKEKDAPPPNRRASSIFDLDLSELKAKSANELWRGVVESKAASHERAIRAAEQAITKWEDDKDVSACPICTTSFHPLTNRKHHCRLCGRVVCSLPPKPPARPATCSLLIVADPRTRRIEEVPDVIAYGVTLEDKHGEREKYVKGVRICRTCRSVVAKQQYTMEAATVPMFSRVYHAMLRLEGQIEEDLPQFQELVLSLKNGTHPNSTNTVSTAAARKALLDRFHEYDRLAKRLRALPCTPGGSQERVQIASLPKMKQLAKAATESESSATAANTSAFLDPGHAVQPLLEQEAMLEQMLSEAQAARKIEDALILKTNLAEIREEIKRLVG
ncbi:Vacuolar segregation protein PEP7 [Ceratobasidium theobromae]|uniref:Vacuolar segregation protein PEP7 n=1 Tax=Ceratobasidium theobromae TaxID=1582974 RepID=A0A5N5QXQ8_9AGAM|nr:Vacuolar segregation protein PEP7 [Ceratobasidium theobromae]